MTIPLFLLFVKAPDDISKAVTVQSVSVLLTGIIAITMALRSKEIKWVKPRLDLSKQLLKEGFRFFLSNLATCKNHGINPCDWLSDVLNRINEHSINKIEELLPQNWTPVSKN